MLVENIIRRPYIEKYKTSHLNKIQEMLERGLLLGFTLDQMCHNFSRREKYFIDVVFVTNEVYDVKAFASHIKVSQLIANILSREIYTKIRRFLLVNFLYKYVRRGIKPVYEETIFINSTGEVKVERSVETVNDQLKDIEDIFFMSTNELKRLSQIAEHIHITLQ
jgi:hypothetical protein